MALLYIKLHTGVTSYKNEKYGLDMTLNKPLAVVEYLGDSSIVTAIQTLQVDQISSNQYYDLLNDTSPSNPVVVNPPYLTEVTDVVGTPDPNAIFFIYQNSAWFQISASNLYLSVLRSQFREVFRVSAAYPTKPQNNTVDYVNTAFSRPMSVFVNGVRLYPDVYYTPTEIASGEIDYFVQNKVATKISRPRKFTEGEVIEIKELFLDDIAPTP